MRIIKYISLILVFGALILSNACDSSKLELKNPNELSPETYFTTPAQVQSAVNSVYGNLQTHGMYNRTMWFAYDNQSHENSGNPQLEADKRQHLDFTIDPTHGAIGQYWESCYRGINRANFVINNQDKINSIPESILPQVTKDKYIGEAKFMRALFYFFLVTRFGEIPLVLEVPQDIKGLSKSPVADIYAQIEADLTDAAAKLLDRADEQLGRATKGAAWALLGKVRLQEKKYAEALTAFQNVTGYSLVANFMDNFLEETEHNSEQIFAVEFNISAGTADKWGAGNNDAGLNESTFRGQEYGCMDWYNVFPSMDCRNEFEVGDPRYGFSFYVNGDSYIGGTIAITPLDQTPNPAFPRIGWRKYENYYKKVSENQESGINMNVIRYADVLLMMAECEANRPTGSLATAIGYMNQVRARASVAMPAYPTATYPCSTLAEFMVALEHERKVELCGEQVRLNDLIRWGRFATFMNYLRTTPGLLPVAEVNGWRFDPNKNLLWPIPRAEMDANPNMTQNPGY